MVPRAIDILSYTLKDTTPIVHNLGRLAMNDLSDFIHCSPVGCEDALQTHADPKNGNLACIVLYCRYADPGITQRVPWSWRNDEMRNVGIFLLDLVERDISRPDDSDISTLQA